MTIPSQQRFVHYFGRLCTPRGQSKAFQRADPVPLDHTEEAMELLSSQAAEDGAIPGDDAAAQAASEKARRAGEVDGEGRRVPRPGAGAAAEEEGEEEEGAESPVFPGPGFALMPPTPVLLLRRVHLSSVPHVAGLRAFGASTGDARV